MNTMTVRFKAGRPKALPNITKKAKAHFDEISDLMDEAGILTVADGGLISRYAQSLADWEDESKSLREEGFVVKTGVHGTRKKNPRAEVVKNLNVVLNQCETALGLSPSARGKINPGQSKPRDNPLAKFISRPRPKIPQPSKSRTTTSITPATS